MGGTRDIEMGPTAIPHEFLEEASRGDAPARAASHVDEIRDPAIDLPPIIIPQREGPTALPGAIARLSQLIDQILIRAKNGRRMVTQCDDHGACEGCTVDDCGRIKALSVGERVRENQAPFGIGVDHLDGLPLA